MLKIRNSQFFKSKFVNPTSGDWCWVSIEWGEEIFFSLTLLANRMLIMAIMTLKYFSDSSLCVLHLYYLCTYRKFCPSPAQIHNSVSSNMPFHLQFLWFILWSMALPDCAFPVIPSKKICCSRDRATTLYGNYHTDL